MPLAASDSGETPKEDIGSPPVSLAFDTRQVSRAAVLKAAYWLSRECDTEFPPSADELTVLVKLHTKPGASPTDIASHFRAAATDFELRIQIERETAGVRELILAKALSVAGVLEPDTQS